MSRIVTKKNRNMIIKNIWIHANYLFQYCNIDVNIDGSISIHFWSSRRFIIENCLYRTWIPNKVRHFWKKQDFFQRALRKSPKVWWCIRQENEHQLMISCSFIHLLFVIICTPRIRESLEFEDGRRPWQWWEATVLHVNSRNQCLIVHRLWIWRDDSFHALTYTCFVIQCWSDPEASNSIEICSLNTMQSSMHYMWLQYNLMLVDCLNWWELWIWLTVNTGAVGRNQRCQPDTWSRCQTRRGESKRCPAQHSSANQRRWA